MTLPGSSAWESFKERKVLVDFGQGQGEIDGDPGDGLDETQSASWRISCWSGLLPTGKERERTLLISAWRYTLFSVAW